MAAEGATYYLNTPGGTVTFTNAVTNTGDVPLINVKTRVTDDKCTPVTYASGDTGSLNILAIYRDLALHLHDQRQR